MIKRYRHTKLKQKLIAAYKELASNFIEYGTPPYNAALIAEVADVDLSSALKSLKAMVEQGIFTTEKAKQPIWNAIAKNHLNRTLTCYWLAETLPQDKLNKAEYERPLTPEEEAAKKAETDAILYKMALGVLG